MKVIICYDVNDNKVRYRLVKYLEKFAVRVQYSVFKADLTDEKITEINHYAEELLSHGANGSFQIYKTSKNCSFEESKDLPADYIIF